MCMSGLDCISQYLCFSPLPSWVLMHSWPTLEVHTTQQPLRSCRDRAQTPLSATRMPSATACLFSHALSNKASRLSRIGILKKQQSYLPHYLPLRPHLTPPPAVMSARALPIRLGSAQWLPPVPIYYSIWNHNSQLLRAKSFLCLFKINDLND